jgi:hypothetical protein
MNHDLHITHAFAHTFVGTFIKPDTQAHLHTERKWQEEARKAPLTCTPYFQQASICHEDMSASARRPVDCRFSSLACDTHFFQVLTIALAIALDIRGGL